jgi:hypothetical protein
MTTNGHRARPQAVARPQETRLAGVVRARLRWKLYGTLALGRPRVRHYLMPELIF